MLKIPSEYNTPEFRKAFIAFTKMRVKKKKPLTNRSAEMKFAQLKTLAGDDVKKAIGIVDQSTDMGWLKFYPLPGDKPKVKKKEYRTGLEDAPEFDKKKIMEKFDELIEELKKDHFKNKPPPF